MEVQKFVIIGELTDHNTYANQGRTNRYIAHSTKRKETERVAYACISSHLQPVPAEYQVLVLCMYYSPSSRKDPDNVCAAKKFILDGLVESGVLINDTRKYVFGFVDLFFIDKEKPRVEVYLYPIKKTL